MIRDFEEEKQEYLKEIEQEHNPPDDGYSFLRFGNTYTYSHSSRFIDTPDFTGKLIQAFDVYNNNGVRYQVVIVYAGLILISMIWLSQPWWPFFTLFFVIAVGIELLARQYEFRPGNKIRLRVTIQGIWIAKQAHVIKWDQLVWSGIRRLDDPETVFDELILYYYDERTDQWSRFKMDMSKLCTNNAELCFYIEYFRNSLHEQQSHYIKARIALS